jgi:hypothetical protein
MGKLLSGEVPTVYHVFAVLSRAKKELFAYASKNHGKSLTSKRMYGTIIYYRKPLV